LNSRKNVEEKAFIYECINSKSIEKNLNFNT